CRPVLCAGPTLCGARPYGVGSRDTARPADAAASVEEVAARPVRRARSDVEPKIKETGLPSVRAMIRHGQKSGSRRPNMGHTIAGAPAGGWPSGEGQAGAP